MDDIPYPSTSPQEQFVSDVQPQYRDFLDAPTMEHRATGTLTALARFAEHTWYYYEYHQDRGTTGNKRKPETFVKYFAEQYSCPELLMVWEDYVTDKHRFNVKPRILRALREGTGHRANGAHPEDISTATGNRPNLIVRGSTDAFVAPSATEQALFMPRRNMFADDIIKRVVEFWERWLATAPVHDQE